MVPQEGRSAQVGDMRRSKEKLVTEGIAAINDTSDAGTSATTIPGVSMMWQIFPPCRFIVFDRSRRLSRSEVMITLSTRAADLRDRLPPTNALRATTRFGGAMAGDS